MRKAFSFLVIVSFEGGEWQPGFVGPHLEQQWKFVYGRKKGEKSIWSYPLF
jgi:hypothetical protein